MHVVKMDICSTSVLVNSFSTERGQTQFINLYNTNEVFIAKPILWNWRLMIVREGDFVALPFQKSISSRVE
ncbi:hypothetical protein FHS70_003590 [Flammeovirga yaeyamensis]|nr:hypothetical protein [Flammeovirga yaeyamensis]